MPSSPLLNEGELNLLVSYTLDGDEDMSVAIVDAFHAANIDVFEKETQLEDWVNADVGEDIAWDSDRPQYLCTEIWDHRVVITADEIRLYTSSMLV